MEGVAEGGEEAVEACLELAADGGGGGVVADGGELGVAVAVGVDYREGEEVGEVARADAQGGEVAGSGDVEAVVEGKGCAVWGSVFDEDIAGDGVDGLDGRVAAACGEAEEGREFPAAREGVFAEELEGVEGLRG